ncbi:MAG: tyrosine-type recombinase/integrase [Nanoarchaeota archaeon]
MNKTQDIHNYKRILDRLIERITFEENFSKANKNTALKFKDELLSQNIGLAKTGRYLQDIIWLNRNFDGMDFEEATKADIKKLVAKMNVSELAESTKKGIKVMLRKLYKFLRGVDGKGKYPPEVNWYTLTISNSNKKIPEELLTENEMADIIKFCKNDRDRALMSLMCESGCRIGEAGSMQIKHVLFEEYGARITLKGKTGMRKILVVKSAPHLRNWINLHSNLENRESPLWPGPSGECLSYARIVNILKESSIKARIRKRVHPHLLRHSRATLMAKTATEATMKHYLGWTQGSNMAAIYIHFSGKDTDDAILQQNGIIIKKSETDSPMKPKKCFRCHSLNGFSDNFCKICSMPLNEGTATKVIEEDSKRQKADNLMNQLFNDPEILNLIQMKISSKT